MKVKKAQGASCVRGAQQNELLHEFMVADDHQSCGRAWDHVESIEAAGEEEVFDLTVPGPHNFIANDIIVHNSIEQDADIVSFIYRDEVYNPDTDQKNIAEISVQKNRNGPTGKMNLFFDKRLTSFKNLAREKIEL
jgi:replicative DNA helicase